MMLLNNEISLLCEISSFLKQKFAIGGNTNMATLKLLKSYQMISMRTSDFG